jgi:hypothetical protein
MGDFGELVLVVGDCHIPHRAAGIPEQFKRMLVPNKMVCHLCTIFFFSILSCFGGNKHSSSPATRAMHW